MSRVFLYVSGDEYSALNFTDNFKEQEVYDQMVVEGVKTKTFENDDYYIDVAVKEFGEIDDKFIDFVKNTIMDYDDSKNADFFEVKPI